MSQIIRSTKVSDHSSDESSKSQYSGGGTSSDCRGRDNNNTTLHKFSSIVNKVESLINKMNNDKLNNLKLFQNQQDYHNENNTIPIKYQNLFNAESRNQMESVKYDQQYFKNMSQSASLDSLNNLTDADSFDDNNIYTDSDDAESAHITGTTSVQVHRHSDLDQLTDETIREFNEQCSSLSRDLDFENAWSTEEDDHGSGSHDHSVGDTQLSLNMCSQREHQISFGLQFGKVSSTNKNNQRDINNNCNSSTIKHLNNNDLVVLIGDQDKNYNEIINCEVKIQKNHINKENHNTQLTTNINNNYITGIVNSKTRRPSNASSDSVGRMETILEEPMECKISVKAILARFETMNMTETQCKSSSLSSGARAAAQILNVPIERLESRQSNHREPTVASNHKAHTSSTSADHDEHFEKSPQQRNLVNNISETHESHENGTTDNDPLTLNSTLMEKHIVNLERNQYLKQASYLHSARKVSASQPHLQEHNPIPSVQHIDANYMPDEQPSDGTAPSMTKYSLLQFAMQHFRNDQISDPHTHSRDTSNDRGDRCTPAFNRSYAELVKWQGTLIRMPLLRLPNDLAPLALECFDCILRYCGDIPLDPEITEVKCVYTVLMHCHKYLALRDEVYCQLMKQTTANRSLCTDSSQRAWRLLSILAAYFGCSEALRPYLMEHLTSAASDRRRSCHGTSTVCLTNLRKTARCGGRKNVPSVEEVTAVSAGRSARRQIYRLPGGAERVVNTRCSTVVADVIAELCALLGVNSEAEQQEFSLYCIVQGDAFTMPLAADEYILDVTTELLKSGQPFYLIFCRSVWHFALKRDPAPTTLYVEVLFNQVAPDYLEGLLLELPASGVPLSEVVRDMARIAALLHRAADLSHVPAMKEIKFLLPKPALGIREIRPSQWVGLVQSAWPQIASLSPGQVKAQFLNVLANWPLFGSSFFAVKRIWAEDGPILHLDESSAMWRDLILALNRRGVLFLDPNTHETLQHWPFMEVISTRKVRSEDGALFLDMKVGNLMQQRVIRVQTEQAHEISRLVRQYITMAQISQRDKRESN